MQTTTGYSEKPRVNPEILKGLQSINHKHNLRILAFVIFYACASSIAIYLTRIIANPWSYLICLPLYILAAASLHGISLFTHEGVHGVLDRNQNWNRFLSIICALPVLQNYSAYKVLHLKHHKHLGLEGDPDHYSNYTKWTWLQFLMYWGRLIIGYPVYIIAIPILGFGQGNAEEKAWISIEVILLFILIAGVILSPIPQNFLIQGWLIPMLFVNTMVNIRGMSQHTLLEHEFDVIRGTRTFISNPITRFFMCNENYHLEHHLYPAVPWYNLPKLHSEIKQELIEQEAPFVPSYLSFVSDFILASLRKSSVGSVAIKS